MARFPLTLGVGLVLGVVVGVGAVEGFKRLQPDPWIEAGGDWVRLPAQTPAGPLPQTFTTPTKAWDYGASTRALSATVTEQPAIVRVEVEQVAGPVGLSLAKPDGSALISKEKQLPVGAARRSLYFRAAQGQPIAVLVRNYDAEGRAGAVTVRQVTYAPEAKLSRRLLGEINKAGID